MLRTFFHIMYSSKRKFLVSKDDILYSNRQPDNIALWVQCHTKGRKNMQRNSGAQGRQKQMVWLGSERTHTKWKFCRRTGNKTCTVRTSKKDLYLQKYGS
jgi:hypothetical protein